MIQQLMYNFNLFFQFVLFLITLGSMKTSEFVKFEYLYFDASHAIKDCRFSLSIDVHCPIGDESKSSNVNHY